MSDERGDSLTVRCNNDANKLFTTSDFDLELALGISRLLYVIYSTRKIEMRDNSSLNYILFDLINRLWILMEIYIFVWIELKG